MYASVCKCTGGNKEGLLYAVVGYICTHLKMCQAIRKIRRLKQFLDFPVTVPCSTCCKKIRFDLSAY